MSVDGGSPAVDKYFDDEGEDAAIGQLENGTNGQIGGEDDDDDVRSRPKRRAAVEEDEDEDGVGDDLFGEEDDDALEEQEKPAARQLDDEGLDSGDDEGRMDRVGDDGEGVEYAEQDRLVMDMEIPRQPVPEPSDGEMYLLKVPPFLAIEPRAWQITTFQPPTTDHHSKDAPSTTFSAFNTATSTIRWRSSPSDRSLLQSNARINRWSDGSLTLQLASEPNTQYEIDGNSLAPPQRNPLKPTPTSIQEGTKNGRHGAGLVEKYNPRNDAFTYLIAPVLSADSLRVTHKITAGLSVKQTESATDDAVERLQAALASAANATKVAGAAGVLEITEEDPELGRKKAEVADRLAVRERKKRENAQERERQRTDRALGRHGLSSGRYGGLNVGMLEDDEVDGGRGRAPAGRARAKPRRRRNSEYSEDEDFGRKRFTREDSYDQEDDFLAPSDEEEEVDDDDDPDDGIVESPREPKRSRPQQEPDAVDEDEDAEGELDDDVPQSRTKRRRVVDEDEEEE